MLATFAAMCSLTAALRGHDASPPDAPVGELDGGGIHRVDAAHPEPRARGRALLDFAARQMALDYLRENWYHLLVLSLLHSREREQNNGV